MAAAGTTSFERVTIEEDEDDDGFAYEEVKVDDAAVGADLGDEGDEDQDESEDLATTATHARQPAAAVVVVASSAISQQPLTAQTTRGRERVDDFVRNYLAAMGFMRTMDAFQTEWYERALSRQFRDDVESAVAVDDAYVANRELTKRVATLETEAKRLAEQSRLATESLTRMQKERDYHRLHHKRVAQEKAKLAEEMQRLIKKAEDRDPEIAQLRQRVEAIHKELTATRVERDALARKLEEAKTAASTTTSTADPATPSKKSTTVTMAVSTTKKKTPTKTTVPGRSGGGTTQTGKKPTSTTAATATGGGGGGGGKGVKTKVQLDISDGVRPNPFAEAGFVPMAVDPLAMQNTHVINAHSSPISSLCVHPRRPIAVTVSDDTTWRMFKLPDGDVVMSGDGHRDWVADCSFHPAGTHLATASGDATVKIWDFANECCAYTFAEHTQAVWSCAFHDSGDFVATASMDHTCKILDIQSQRCRQALRGHLDSVNYVGFQPFTNHVCTCSADKTVSVWDIRLGECLKTFFGHAASCNHVAFNLVGDTLISTDTDGEVRLWDLRMVKERLAIHSGPFSATKASFDHTGTLVFIASDDGSIKVHDIVKDKPVVELRGHQDAVQGLAFLSPFSASSMGVPMLLSAGTDGTLRSWTVPQ